MKIREALLSKMEEEALELAHRISKALHFGLHEVQDGQPFTNVARINQEFNDLLATEQFLVDFLGKEVPIFQADTMMIRAKKEKLVKYLMYSAKQGIIDDIHLIEDDAT